jgi:hypothetical protein
MPPKSVEETHTPLQAVVLADSFTQPFRPITIQRPKVPTLPISPAALTHRAVPRRQWVSIWAHATLPGRSHNGVVALGRRQAALGWSLQPLGALLGSLVR